MADSKAAVKPDVFQEFRNLDRKRQTEKPKELSPDDRALASLAVHDGWVVLNREIETLKRQIDELVNVKVSEGINFEDIGRLTVAANLAKEKLYAVQKRVEDARDEAEGTER